MSVALAVAATAIALNSQSHATGGAIGPVIWQGIMVVLVIPFGGFALWAYFKEPLVPYTEEEWKRWRFWRRVWIWTLFMYGFVGISLLVYLIKQGI
jgi:hypothetical protein